MILIDMPFWMLGILTGIITVALLFHASEFANYRRQGNLLSHVFILLGWSVIVYRSWSSILGDTSSISYAGGLGLLLLSGGLILRSTGK